jgi:putative FmdB family regulatory protein
MPLYEYQCEPCEHRFERIRKYSDPPLDTCPVCGGPVKKLLSSPAIQFKGSGFYITDYAKKTSGEGNGAGKESSDSGGGEAAAAPAKESKDSKESKGSTDSQGSQESKGTKESSPPPASKKD